jgi:hypothetical protein
MTVRHERLQRDESGRQPPQHTQLAVALARIAADGQIKHSSAGERKESRDARQGKAKTWLLLRRLPLRVIH